MIPNIFGDVYILRLDLFDLNTLDSLREITSYCRVFYDINDDFKLVLAVNIEKKIVKLDLSRLDVFEGLQKLGNNDLNETLYSIYFETSPKVFTPIKIDLNDAKTKEILLVLERPKLPSFLFELKYQDLDLSVWKIVIDVNNYEIMDKLMEFSEKTTNSISDSSQIINLKLISPQGRQFELKLDKTNPSTLQILKESTLKSTGLESELLIKPKTKNLQYIEIIDVNQEKKQIAIDVNNLQVLKKLQQIVDSQNTNVSLSSISFKMPDGSLKQIKIDLNDAITIENLLKLSIESERGIPARLIRIKKAKRFIPILVSFPIMAPFIGSFTVTVDVGKIEITERIKELSQSYIGGRSEFELNLRDSSGQEILLRLDLTNSTTLYQLIMLTIDSIGVNPTGIDPIEVLNHQIYVPDVLTIEIPDNYEMLPISIDRASPEIVEIIKKLSKDFPGNNPQPNSINSIELIENKHPIFLSLDTFNLKVQSVLRSLSIQTLMLLENRNEKTKLFGIFLINYYEETKTIFLDLSQKEIVIEFIKLTQKLSQNNINNNQDETTYFEVRDESSQFVTLNLNLNDGEVIETLIRLNQLGSNQNEIFINAKKLPYLIMCLPNNDLRKHDCVKTKLKPSVLSGLEAISESPDSIQIKLIDSFNQNRHFFISKHDRDVFQNLDAAFIQKPLTINILIISTTDNDETAPIYIDLTNPKVLDLLIELDSSFLRDNPFSIVTYEKDNVRMYFKINLDYQLVERLSRDVAIVSGHSIFKQKPYHKTTINVPNSSDGSIIPIVLDMADKEVVHALKELSNNFDGPSPTIINLEDVYGFPFQIKLDIYDEKTIGQLIQLSNKQQIV